MKRIKNQKTGFTLIEMLAVLFIIGIIFSITLPTFGPIMRTLKLTTSAENLANTLESARQYAITSGQDCYVVFPTTDEYAYKAYKMYVETGIAVGRLEVLPNSLKIDGNSTFLTQNNNTIDVPFPDESSGVNSLRYISFSPSGKANARASVKIIDPQTDKFNCVTFYNSPNKVKVWDLGDEPEEDEE